MSNDTSNRDALALERTRLANERTFLAYVRTSLALLAAAAVILQFFPDGNIYMLIACLLAASGLVVITIGLYRFYKVRQRLRGAGS